MEEIKKCENCKVNQEGNFGSCHWDEEFNPEIENNCNCCESCRNECLYSI